MSRKRYKHWLAPVRGDVYPDAIVCVEVSTNQEATKGDKSTRTDVLKRWHSTSSVWNGEKYEGQKQVSSIMPEDFWSRLHRLTEKANNVWVFTSCAPRAWSTLGLFDYLEGRHIYFSDLRTSTSGKRGHNKATDDRSLIVFEDPTNAVRIRISGTAGKITMVDLRNYGVDLDQNRLRPLDRLGRSYRFVVSMIEALRLGEWGSLQVTVSSQAMYTYRRSFMSHSIHAHSHHEALQLENRAYVGGRCEAYRLGTIQGKTHYLDFNSLYASVALVESVPVQLKWYENFRSPVESYSLRDDLPQTADVLIQTSEPIYPFPHHGIVVYPVGEFRTALTGPELWFALQRGHILRVYSAAWYEMRPAMHKFMDVFLKMREHMRFYGLQDMGDWVKRMLVGLVGKFGQRGGRWETQEGRAFDCPWSADVRTNLDGKRERWRTIAGIVQREIPEDWGPEAVPSIAAWITSASRFRLTQAIKVCGWENVCYVDTDSIMCNDAGYERLDKGRIIGSGEPGTMRLVETCEDCTVRGYKSYTAGTRSANSGIPRGTVQQSGSILYSWFVEWLSAALKEYRAPDSRAKMVKITNNRPYRHGVVQGDGSVKPYILPDDLPHVGVR